MDTAFKCSKHGYSKFEAAGLRERAKALVPGATAIWDIQLPHEIPE